MLRPTDDAAIAVTGLGCWYPDARSPQQLWENVLARRQAFRRLPACRLPLDSYHDADPRAPDKTYGAQAALIDGFEFDWVGKRVPKRTYEATDIVHWLALDVALRALVDAGYSECGLPHERTGVIVGNSLTGEQNRSQSMRVRWPFVERALRTAARQQRLAEAHVEELVRRTRDHFKSVFPAVSEDTLAGALSNTIAGRICNFLDLQGGGYTVDGACASSLLAVATAANALCNRDLDMVLAGGVDVSLDPFELVGFAKVGALSPNEMRVYDKAAAGFIPGEGCGFVVLKRLADARADGDYVYAVLRGWGVSSDGAGGITAPAVNGQSLAIRRAYKRAGYSPQLLHFVEGHGTGTPVGDPIELRAIADAMASYGATDARSCGLTSLKSIMGHTKAAAGIGGFIKAVISTNRRVIPPTAGCTNPSAAFEKDALVLYPVQQGRVFDPDDRLRAGVSAMGFGGINTHATIESGDPPAARLQPSVDERALVTSGQDSELFVAGAASLTVLATRLKEIRTRCDGMSLGEMVDLAVDTNRDTPMSAPARWATVASTPAELEQALALAITAIAEHPPSPGEVRRLGTRSWLSHHARKARVGFLFPGQGSQQVGMASTLVRRHAWADRLLQRCDEWLAEIGIQSVSKTMHPETDRAHDQAMLQGWGDELRRTENAQPAICVASLLWLKFLGRLGIQANVVGGHSLGELSALRAAGAIDDRALVQMAGNRGQSMAAVQRRGAMISLGCDAETARQIVDGSPGYCTVANLNAPEQTVVSGDTTAIDAVERLANARGIANTRLPVSGAFHSLHFRPAAAALSRAPEVPALSEPLQITMLSAMDGSPLPQCVAVRTYLSRQLCAQVDFVSLAASLRDRCDVVLEVGPGRILSNLLSQCLPNGALQSFAIEATPGRDRDLNLAIAALYAQGHRPRLDALYENRLHRPFIPAFEKKFIENPCERRFDESTDRPTLGVSERAPVRAPQPPSPNHHHEHPLQLPSRTPAAPPIVAAAPPPPAATTAPALCAPAVGEREAMATKVQATVLQSVQTLTGFPVETLTLDLHLVDDLHLDSIKTVELVSDLSQAFDVAAAVDPAKFTNATLGDLVELLTRTVATRGGGVTEPAAPARAPLDPSHPNAQTHTPDIEHYAMRWDQAPLATSKVEPGGHTLLVASDGHEAAALGLSRALAELGIDHEVCTAQNLRARSGPPASHLIALCPAPSPQPESTRAVANFLSSVAQSLPRRDRAGAPRSVAFVRTMDDAQGGCFDWSADAFAASIHLERGDLLVRSLSFSPRAELSTCMATALVNECADDSRFAAARYDARGRRWTCVPVPQDRSLYPPRHNPLGSDDVVLITGGAKGITAKCALALAEQTRATMVLAGSSPPPDAHQADHEIRHTLEEFGRRGLRCSYHQCDLTDAESVAALVTNVRNRVGPITAVVHGAGLNRPASVHTVNADEAYAEAAPKLQGALHLFDALSDAPPKLFVALTSIIGVAGMPRNAWYAWANQALAASLRRFGAVHAGTDTLAIAYSVWDEVGMGAKLGSLEQLKKLGIEVTPVAEGAARFVELVTHQPDVSEVVVTPRLGGFDTWQPAQRDTHGVRRFIENIIKLQPGAELICRTSLSRSRDSYVEEHVYKGSYLFPTVFGLEAMAQAAARVTGQQSLPFPLTISDIVLDRPLVVGAERPLLIEIHARVHKEAAVERVRVGIRSEKTGFSRDHFAATFELDTGAVEIATPPLPAAAIELPAKPTLYGPILFQGGRFQRIVGLSTLDPQRCLFSVAGDGEETPWLLGDPYTRDALLQSLQLCVVPDQCLPVHIGRLHIRRRPDPSSEARPCYATIDRKDGDCYVGSVSRFGGDGQLEERLDAYRARILDRRDDWPDAETLAAPFTVRAASPAQPDSTEGVREASRVYTLERYGYHDQDAFVFRFPLTAQDCCSLGRRLYFAQFFKWMGKLREVCGLNTPGAYVQILDMLRSNEVTSATNSFETEVLRTPRANDVIEGRLWVARASSVDCDAVCEWWALPFAPNRGEPVLIARSRMTISAVKVLEDGTVRATTWPDYFFGFLELMGPRSALPTRSFSDAPSYDYGACLFQEPPGPKRSSVLLAEQTFDTSLQDANVVGNIYFASYGAWQGRLRDRFFYELSPETFRVALTDTELVCTDFKMTQLREAMPFDRVRVKMYLRGLFERAAQLSFQYFLVERDGTERKLAVGEQTALWASHVTGSHPVPTEWPSEIREGLVQRLNIHNGVPTPLETPGLADQTPAAWAPAE